jgi:DNA-binding SARP family transcriptional activator
MPMPRLYLTGGLVAEHRGHVVDEGRLAGRQGALVLAALAWRPGTAVERDRLADVLWEERTPPASWETAVATVISSLRHALAPADLAVESTWGAYRLATTDGEDPWVDVDAARRALHHAEAAVHGGRMEQVYAWTGVVTSISRRPLLAGIDGAWLDHRRRELTELRIRGLDCAVRFCRWNGEHSAAVAHARTMLELDPLREPSQRALMEAQLAAGDRASALRTYEECRRLLSEQLGADPSEATRALHERMLR